MMDIRLAPDAYMPIRAHEDDAGLDIRTPKGYILYPNQQRTIATGISVALPKNSVGYIKARSSLFSKGIMTDGTIDEGYTGEIKVVLWNVSEHAFIIKRGDKIAQLVVHNILKPELNEVDELVQTERGGGGFGSTGR